MRYIQYIRFTHNNSHKLFYMYIVLSCPKYKYRAILDKINEAITLQDQCLAVSWLIVQYRPDMLCLFFGNFTHRFVSNHHGDRQRCLF